MPDIIDAKSCIDITRYPTGETRLSIKKDSDILSFGPNDVLIWDKMYSWQDVMEMVTLTNTYSSLGPEFRLQIFVPYLPFARDDRRRNLFDSNELSMVMDILKSLDATVFIADPHSYVSGQMTHISQKSCFDTLIGGNAAFDDVVFAIPDKGATPKAQTWLGDRDWVQCDKVRDMDTGKLSGFSVDESGQSVEGRTVVIYDDICDGGGTFLGLAEKLKELAAKEVHLAVTHGIFSKGTGELAAEFDSIQTFGENEYSGVNYTPWERLFDGDLEII